MVRAHIAWVLIALLACAAGGAAASKTEQNFQSLSREILDNLQQFWPVHSTMMGIHEYDGRFTDYSPKSVEKERKKLRTFLARLYKYKGIRLPVDMDIDSRLLSGNCEIAMLRLSEVGYHNINPNLYINAASDGIYYILINDYKPLASRLDDIIARMQALPQFLQQGEADLKAPPPLWLDYAKTNVANVIELFRTTTDQLLAQFPDRASELKAASSGAVAGLEHFQNFLETLSPGEPGSFAIGKEYFDYILAHEYFFDFDADSLLKIGERLLAVSDSAVKAYRAEMESEGFLKRDSVFVPPSITKQDVLDYYNWEINTVKNFVIDHDLITVPANIGLCEAVETPVFLRGIIGGLAYEPPGPFDAATTGYFYVPPIPDELTEAQRRHYYLQMDNRDFRGSVVHEAYPGHHLQLQLAARVGSDVRKWQMNNALIEGWALYCEEMAYDAGLYDDNPAAYLRVLGGIRFRAARIVVDVKLQTGQFSYDQAVAWMSQTLDSDTNYIKTEVLRYTGDPGQPMSYLMGKRAIMKLRNEVMAREGDSFTLKSFHDRLLSEGSIPVSLIRKKMLK